MPYNSTVRLHQLNLPELSGYISLFLNTGTSSTGSGINILGSGRTIVSNSGNIFFVGSNDYNLATSGDLNNLFYSILTGNVNLYYSKDNPSGFVTLNQLQTGQFSISNLQWFNNTGFKIVNITPSSFDINGPTSKIQFYQNTQNPSSYPYVSGFDFWGNNLNINTINNLPVISSGYINSGFVKLSQFSLSSTGFNYLYLKDDIKLLDSKFFQGSDFYFKGQDLNNISNNYIIDLYGSLALTNSLPSGKPFILGFDIYGGKITSSGNQVLTFADTGLYISPAQLLNTSGSLMDSILRYRSSGSSPYSVLTTGNQTISGIKTFQSINTSGLLISGNLLSDYYATIPNVILTGLKLQNQINSLSGLLTGTEFAIDYRTVHKTGDESILGVKTFLNIPIMSSGVAANLILPTDYIHNFTSIDTISDLIFDHYGIASISWFDRLLLDSTATPSINWQTKNLIGTWNVDNLFNSGFNVITSNQTGNFITTGQTGNFGIVNTGSLTGIFYPLSNPSGFITSGSYIPTNNQTGGYFYITNATSGVLQEFINFPANLGNNPIVLCSLSNRNSEENILVQPSGINSSGYWAQYSNIISNTGFLLTTFATITTQTGLAVTVIIQGSGGTITGSYYPLNSNPSGYITTGQTGAFGTAINTGALTGAFYSINNPLGFIGSTTLSLALQTGLNTYVDIGNFSISNGAHNIEINATVSSFAFSVAKTYRITVPYTASANWKELIPDSTSGPYLGEDFAIDCQANGSIMYLRARKSLGTAAGTLNLKLTNLGFSTDIYTQTFNTGIVAAPPQISYNGLSGLYYPYSGNPSNYITSSSLSLYYLNNNPSGFITGFNSGLYVLNTNTGIFITTGQTGNFGIVNTGSLTGIFYPLSNPSGFLTSISGNINIPSKPFTININWASGNLFRTTLTGDTNFTFSNAQDGQTIVVSVSNSGGMGYYSNFPSGSGISGVYWPNNAAPIQTSGNYTDIYTFIDITGRIYGNAVQGYWNF